MSRSEYHNLRKTNDREQWVKTICERLGVEPDYNTAIDFALAVTVSGLAVPNTASSRLLVGTGAKPARSNKSKGGSPA
jgi:hypothetical protein